ncbi:MAG: hypothetical protein P8018_12960 [Acidobacteriota bacterium]
MFLSRVRWGLEYLAVACLRLFLAPMPSSLRVTFGMGLGWLAYRVDKRHRNVALDNLKVSYPDKDEAWRRRTARMAFQNLGRLLVEIPFQKAKVRRRLESTRIEGWEYLQEASQQGRGYFLVSGHFGNWEWIAHLQGALGHPLWMITRPMDNPYLESFTAKRRECTGNRVVHKRQAVREIVKGLKQGLGIVFAYPEGKNGYRVVYGPPVTVPQDGGPQEDSVKVTAEATRRLEAAVREIPHAWFWMHRRWRSQPDDAVD